jgi:hypothetical protein
MVIELGSVSGTLTGAYVMTAAAVPADSLTKLDFQGLATAFIDVALSDSQRAGKLLAAHPEIAGAIFYAALVLGDVDRVEQALNENPELAAAKGGPRDCQPLLYICFSRFAGA